MITRGYAIVWDKNTGPIAMFRSVTKAQKFCDIQNKQFRECRMCVLSILSGEDADCLIGD